MTVPLITGLLFIALVGGVLAAIPNLTRPSLPFGVRVPPERIADPAIILVGRTFRRRLLGLAVIAAVAVLPLLLVLASPTVLAVIPAGYGAAGIVVYYLAHRRVRQAKQDGAWYAGARQGVTADLSLRTDPVRLPWLWLVPSLLILAATAVVGAVSYPDLASTLPTLDDVGADAGQRTDTTFGRAFLPVFLQAGSTVLAPLTALAIRRSRPDLDAAQPGVSARRWRTYLGGVIGLILATTVCLNLTMLLVALRLWELVDDSVAWAVATYAPLAVPVIAFVLFEIRVGQAGHRVALKPGEPEESTGVVQRDDDRFWHLGGFVYANRNDPAIMVHQRAFGASWTMNLGHPATWIVLAALIVVAVLVTTGVIDLPGK